MNDQRARVRRVLSDHVLGEQRPLLSSRPGTEGLLDREHVVIDGLGKSNHCQFVTVLMQIRSQVCCRSVCVVASDGVRDLDTIAGELFGCGLQWVSAIRHEAALDAVINVGQLDSTIADRAATEVLKEARRSADFRCDLDRTAAQQAVVAPR